MEKKINTIEDSKEPENVVVAEPRRGIGRRPKIIAASLVIVLISFMAGLSGALLITITQNRSPLQAHGSSYDGNKIVTQEEEDIAAVASKVAPSVVSIVTSAQTMSFYGAQTQEGAGTGIIVSSDGYVLTNKHVIQNSQSVAVVTSDGVKHSDVKVIGTDPLNDVAYLKISGVNGLKPAELGDSSSVRIGQKVVAIGNSLGQYQNTVTSGIISGTGRPVAAQSEEGGKVETLTDLLQTDAAINPGNSGGPLTNLAGQVIGINTAIAQGAQSIGFSIPINATKGTLKGVLADGKVTRAYVGVNYLSITPDVADEYKLSVRSGAYVLADGDRKAVVADSPADKAGIKDKDIITKVNDIDVGDKGSVASLIGEYAPGETVQMTLLRDGKTMTVNVTLAAYNV